MVIEDRCFAERGTKMETMGRHIRDERTNLCTDGQGEWLCMAFRAKFLALVEKCNFIGLATDELAAFTLQIPVEH